MNTIEIKDCTYKYIRRNEIDEVVEKKLQVIDLSASILCLENRLPLSVFSLEEEDGIAKALLGEHRGTRVTAD